MKRNNIHPANKKRIASQREKILAWLLSGRTITTMDAILKIGCTRLSARIYEIRDMGHNVESKMVCKFGRKVAEYKIIQYQPGMAM